MRERIQVPDKTRFGKLVVVREVEGKRVSDRTVRRQFLCRCDCGRSVYVTIDSLLYRNRKQCRKTCAVGAGVKHGMARRASRDPIYNNWQSILARCENPRATGYKYWGGRGIRVHGPWHDPLVFKADVERALGPRPSTAMTIERLDVNGHYEPGNIAWLSKSDQPKNRRQKYDAAEVAKLVAQAVVRALADHHCEGCQCEG